jgi:glycerophosphoryl diester phosphodiesterase
MFIMSNQTAISKAADIVRVPFGFLTGDLLAQAPFVAQAHSNNITVFAYCLRFDEFQPFQSPEAVAAWLLLKGVDGIYTDYV